MKDHLEEDDFERAAQELGVEVAAIKAVCGVEAPRGGFNPDDTPVTLFEGHKFHAFTGGLYDGEVPDLSYPKWTRQFYGHTWEAEQDRLQRAIALDQEAAYMAASWGKFQLMGFNFADCGFETVDAFVDAMRDSEDAQLEAFVHFIRHAGLGVFMNAHDWANFAHSYNGPGYKDNQYDVKLAQGYARAKGEEA